MTFVKNFFIPSWFPKNKSDSQYEKFSKKRNHSNVDSLGGRWLILSLSKLLLLINFKFPTPISLQVSSKYQPPTVLLLVAASQFKLQVVLIFSHQSLLGIQNVPELCTPHSSGQLQQTNGTVQRRRLVYHEMKLFWTWMAPLCGVSWERMRWVAYVHHHREGICNRAH